MAFCEDGDAIGHRWSEGYAGYTHAETARKLDRARDMSGATTCGHFQSLDPGRCAGCPYLGRINSPVSLGYEDGPATSVRTGGADSVGATLPDRADRLPDLSPDLNGHRLDLSQIGLPEGFAWKDNSLVFTSEKAKGGEADILVSKHPIYLESLQRGEAATDRYAGNFKSWFPREGWKDIPITIKKLSGNDGLSELSSLGASISDGQLFRRYIVAAIDKLKTEKDFLTQYEQFGWKDNAFLWGRRIYEDGGVRLAIANEELKNRAQHLQPRPGGSLEKWSEAADRLFAKDCEPQAFALLASFAAPLMRFHSTDEGGALVALVSPESGTGKTTALAAAASVWGRYDGLSLNTFDTRVAKGITMGVLGNLPAIFDEIASKDPEVLKEFVLTFTNGRDRLRGNADGGIRHVAARWQTILIAGANRSIVELVSSVGETDAPGFRIIEMQTRLPPGTTRSTGDELKQTLDQHSGHAADEYLAYLTLPEVRAWLPQALRETTQEMWERTKLRHEHRFWIRTLASVSVAAKLVKRLELLSFSPDRIINWVIDHLTADQKAETDVTNRRVENSVSILTQFLNHMIQDTITVDGPFKPHTKAVIHAPHLRSLQVRYERSNQRFLIADRPFKMWLKAHNIPARQLIEDLKFHGVVTRDKVLVTLSAGTDIPGGQTLCVEVFGGHPLLTGMPIDVRKMAPDAERKAG